MSIRPYAKVNWRSPLIGVYVDADYLDMVDVMIGLGPFWLIVEVRRG